MKWTMYGQFIETPDISEMTSPVRCSHCGGVYDLRAVTVTVRYMDCSVWRSPCCGLTVDDRTEGWKLRADYVRLQRAENEA